MLRRLWRWNCFIFIWWHCCGSWSCHWRTWLFQTIETCTPASNGKLAQSGKFSFSKRLKYFSTHVKQTSKKCKTDSSSLIYALLPIFSYVFPSSYRRLFCQESPDFLFSWQIAVCLGEALQVWIFFQRKIPITKCGRKLLGVNVGGSQAEMPVETQQLATAALGSWAAIRMKTQVLGCPWSKKSDAKKGGCLP